MWSDRKFVNYTIDILLFLLGLNIFHYGQLLLPVMCFILFVDKKCRFYVKQPAVFVVLCLFAISFYYFSYELGFYGVMGFCLPMAYYIGSNCAKPTEENIKKIIYLIAFGMAVHLVLNFGYDYTVLGNELMRRNSHYDIWTRGYVAANTTSVNLVMIISCIYYLVFYEKNRRIKITGIVLFIISLIYDLALGKRMPMFILAISVLFCVIYDILFVTKNKKMILVIIIPCIMLGLLLIMYFTDMFGIRNILDNLRFVIKIKSGLFDFDRLRIILRSFEYFPTHLWGGQEVSSLMGIQIHELWLDVFDYAGVISYVLILIYTFVYLYSFIKTVIKRNLNSSFRLLMFSFLICSACVMFLEPVMTGSSLFLICVIIIGTSFTLID